MKKTRTLQQISQFSNAEIDQFIADFLANEFYHLGPDSGVIQNIMKFSRIYCNPMGSENFPGYVSN
ncbi:MAG: hypothetical protein ACOCPM_03600 [Bacteroidales bacterium]